MDNVSVAQRLAIEKQLLAEEKLLVHCLKTIREERHACQKEAGVYLSVLEAVSKGKERNTQGQNQEKAQQTETESKAAPVIEGPSMNDAASTQQYEINLESLDDIAGNVELDLTVPSHNLYEQTLEEEYEEFDEELDSEDDYEIDMGLFMYGLNDTIKGQQN